MPKNDPKDRGANSPLTSQGQPRAYWDIKELSQYLQIKRSTLYAWVEQRKIPFVKIHGLIRFQRDEIERWVESFRPCPPTRSAGRRRTAGVGDLDAIIASAKREVYTASRGKPDQDRAGKEGHDGTV